MAEEKRNLTQDASSGLKKVNNKKSGVQMGADVFKGQGINSAKSGAGIKIKRRVPLWVDILTGILMLVIVCGVVVGSYMLFRYYSNDYDEVAITYTVIVDGANEADLQAYESLKDDELFMDTEDNSVYFGKVTDVSIAEGKILMTVSAKAKHRDGEGYSIGESRIAVGSDLLLRSGEYQYDVDVVALKTGGK